MFTLPPPLCPPSTKNPPSAQGRNWRRARPTCVATTRGGKRGRASNTNANADSARESWEGRDCASVTVGQPDDASGFFSRAQRASPPPSSSPTYMTPAERKRESGESWVGDKCGGGLPFLPFTLTTRGIPWPIFPPPLPSPHGQGVVPPPPLSLSPGPLGPPGAPPLNFHGFGIPDTIAKDC